jgi:hypothetical protein
MAKIGLVSSIALPNNLLDAVRLPLLNGGHTVSYEHASGDYDANSKRKMKKAVRKIGNVASLELVVAVGGLVAARAVSDYIDAHDDIPFLICVGRAPNEGSSLWENDQFIGGINLDTANQNTSRATALMQRHPSLISNVSSVCLLYNKNSHMAAREAKEWSFFGPTKESCVDQAAYDPSHFASDFTATSLPRGTQAMIVSSDPFFASKAADLTAAARAWGKPVCYPNELYKASALPGMSMIYGPNLEAAYGALSAKALAYLSAATKPKTMGMDTPMPVRTDV